MHEHVAAGRQAGQREVLALQVRRVVVAVADRDALLDPEQPRLLEAAAARVHRLRRSGGQLAPEHGVAVAQAEARLAVADDRGSVPGTTQLVVVEPEQVPVPVVGRDHVADLAGTGDHLHRRAVAFDQLIRHHRARVRPGAVGVEDERPVTHVLDRRAKAKDVDPLPAGAGSGDHQIAWRRLVEVRQPFRSGESGGRSRDSRESSDGEAQGKHHRKDP